MHNLELKNNKNHHIVKSRQCRELIWRTEEMWVLLGSPDCRVRTEKEWKWAHRELHKKSSLKQ